MLFMLKTLAKSLPDTGGELNTPVRNNVLGETIQLKTPLLNNTLALSMVVLLSVRGIEMTDSHLGSSNFSKLTHRLFSNCLFSTAHTWVICCASDFEWIKVSSVQMITPEDRKFDSMAFIRA